MRKLSSSEWESRARKVHGNKYDYSKSIWGNKNTRINVVCRACGVEFHPLVGSHIYGRNGCPECSLARVHELNRYTTESFIRKSQKVHGLRYDYSKVQYKHCTIPVQIVCPVHGVFYQRPESHLRGRGCPNKDHEREFYSQRVIEKLKAKLRSDFDIKNMVYSGSKKPVLGVVCKVCGTEIRARSGNLLSTSGRGCVVCQKRKWNQAIKDRTQEFQKNKEHTQ